MLEGLTLMGVLVIAMKLGLVGAGTTGVAASIHWFNKKSFKKGGSKNDFDDETTRFHNSH
jgi:hypothetical protein